MEERVTRLEERERAYDARLRMLEEREREVRERVAAVEARERQTLAPAVVPPAVVAPSPGTAPAAPAPTAPYAEPDERALILAALEKARWNKVKAAELLGMPRRTLYRRLHEYGLLTDDRSPRPSSS